MSERQQGCEITRCLDFQITAQEHTNKINKWLMIAICALIVGILVISISTHFMVKSMTESYNATLQKIACEYFGYENPVIEQSQSIDGNEQ